MTVRRGRAGDPAALVPLLLTLTLAAASAAPAQPPAPVDVAAGATDAGPGLDTALDPALREQLEALGYSELAVGAEEVEGDLAAADLPRGVTLHDAARAHPGYNLYNSRRRNRARLVSMDGELVHEWHAPGLEGSWHHVEAMPDGDLVVIQGDGGLVRLDPRGRVRWHREDLGAHHDVALGPDGELFVLGRRIIRVPFQGRELPVLDDRVLVLSPGGEVRRDVSIHALFGTSVRKARLGRIARRLDELAGETGAAGVEALDPALLDRRRDLLDLYHANSLAWIDRDLGGRPTRGTLLTCLRNLDTIAIVDLDGPRVTWSWGAGELDRPHQPSVTAEGRILIFDNGYRRRWSRLLELDVATGAVGWTYRADPPRSFFSAERGGAQQLPGGNVLVTESDRGRVFEITRAGERVWEFYNPDLAGADGSVRVAIYRMTRTPLSFLRTLRRPAPAAARP